MKKIEKLTPEQIARFPEFVEKWTRIGLDTRPADRPRAEAAICKMYEIAGFEAPRVVWCSSPIAMALTFAVVKEISEDNVGASMGTSVRASVRASAWTSVRASVWDSVRASVRDSVGTSVGASVGTSVWDSVGTSVRASVYGQHDASWLGFYDYFSAVLALVSQTQKLEGLWELSKSAGWALPYSSICWVSERHCVVRQDDRKRIHCENGPAISYPDGWSIYAWHGVRVPSEWIENKKVLTAALALGQQNIEQRRAACEIVGWNRILSELNAKIIDRDADPQIGELVEVSLPEAGRERFLRVLCGTGREFAIPVPPNVRTALEANAWTYDLPTNLMKQKEART